MDGKNSPESSLPWFWIIEYLAKFEQVKPSLLHGIIKAALETSAHLGDAVEEVVSLRCLEELCGPRNASMNGTWSSLESKAKIDTSKSCKNVLQSMFHKDSASDLGVTANELLKWDLHSFLVYKRASVPKTSLEELKDAILRGTHPYADSSKKLSGLAHASHLDRAVIHNGGRTGLTSVPDAGDACAPNTVEEPNLASQPTNHIELSKGDDNIRTCLSTKRHHTDVHAENIENQHHDAHSDAKRAKQQDSDKRKDGEESPVVLAGSSGVERVNGCSEREMAKLVEDQRGSVDGMSSDSDEYRKEEMDVTLKKHEFLYSQSQCLSPRHAFATVDWSEQNVCMKCNEGGQLLVCNTSSCPLMVHENCVGLSAMFDDNGMFYCPFCAYSIAISGYHDAKKEESLTRRNLSAFIHAGLKHQQENLDRMKQSLSGNGTSDINRVNDPNEMDVNGDQLQGSKSDGEQDDPSQRCNGGVADIPSREDEEMVHGGASTDAAEFLEGNWNKDNKSNVVEGTSNLEKQIEENKVQEQPSGRVLEKEQDQVLENNLFANGSVAYKDTCIVPVNQRDGVRDELDVLSKGATDTPDGGASANNTAEEASEDEDDETSISNYRISFRGQINQEEASANPLFRQNEASSMGEEVHKPEPASQLEPNSESLPSGQLRPLLPLPSKHISRFSSRGRRCLKTYASSVVHRRSARIRSFTQRSQSRTKDDACTVIEID